MIAGGVVKDVNVANDRASVHRAPRPLIVPMAGRAIARSSASVERPARQTAAGTPERADEQPSVGHRRVDDRVGRLRHHHACVRCGLAQIEADDPAERRARVAAEIQRLVAAVDEVPAGVETRHEWPRFGRLGFGSVRLSCPAEAVRRRRRKPDHVDLGVIAGALIAADHEMPIVGRDVHLEDDFRGVRPVIDQPIARLRLADAVIPDLAEVLLLIGRHRARLRIARIEKAVAVPRDRRELHPFETIGERGPGRHVVHQQLLDIAAVARQTVDHAIAGVVWFEDRDRRRAVLAEAIGIDEYPSLQPLVHSRRVCALSPQPPAPSP